MSDPSTDRLGPPPSPAPPTRLLEESPGVTSSKRVFGAVLISAGGALLSVIGVVAIFAVVKDPDTALECGKALIKTGAVLLGVCVLEGIGRKGD